MSRHWPWLLLVPAVLFVVIRGLSPGRPLELEKQELLKIHAELIRAHLENDLEAWLDLESDFQTVISQGEILHPTRAERAVQRSAYLESTRFTRYEDLIDPVAVVSEDGSLGWVSCQVRVEGVQTDEDGTERELASTWAWIELYEKSEGRWRLVGNVSNRHP